MAADICSQLYGTGSLGQSVKTEETADSECALALLELAMSVVPSTGARQEHDGIASLAAASAMLPMSDDLSLPKTEDGWPLKRKSSLLKRELEMSSSGAFLPGFGYPYSASLEYEMRQELVKRVKLDHNYFWSGEDRMQFDFTTNMEAEDFRRYCESLAQGSESGPNDNSEDNNDDSAASFADIQLKMNMLNQKFKPKAKKPKDVFSDVKNCTRIVRVIGLQPKRTVMETMTTKPKKKKSSKHHSSSKTSDNSDPYEFRDDDSDIVVEKKTIPKKSGKDKRTKSPKKANKKSSGKAKVKSKSARPRKEKYHGFNLLLKCLADNSDNSDTPGASHEGDSENIPHNVHNTASFADLQEVTFSESETATNEVKNEYPDHQTESKKSPKKGGPCKSKQKEQASYVQHEEKPHAVKAEQPHQAVPAKVPTKRIVKYVVPVKQEEHYPVTKETKKKKVPTATLR